MKEKEFDLSGKRTVLFYNAKVGKFIYTEEDVKEFIRRLKFEMELTIENANIINKLAGKNLARA